MMYPSAATSGNEFSPVRSSISGYKDTGNIGIPERAVLWSTTLDKTGQIGESGIWEPVKWQSPGGHHLHTDYVGFKKEYTTEIQWEPDTTSLSTGKLHFEHSGMVILNLAGLIII